MKWPSWTWPVPVVVLLVALMAAWRLPALVAHTVPPWPEARAGERVECPPCRCEPVAAGPKGGATERICYQVEPGDCAHDVDLCGLPVGYQVCYDDPVDDCAHDVNLCPGRRGAGD